jgi:hypothetical protein
MNKECIIGTIIFIILGLVLIFGCQESKDPDSFTGPGNIIGTGPDPSTPEYFSWYKAQQDSKLNDKNNEGN